MNCRKDEDSELNSADRDAGGCVYWEPTSQRAENRRKNILLLPRIDARKGGVLSIYCDVSVTETNEAPFEVEMIWSGMAIDIPPGDFQGIYPFEFVIRDATGLISDRRPRLVVKNRGF